MSPATTNQNLREYLREVTGTDAQHHHLALRAAHTTGLTQAIESSSAWMVQRIVAHSTIFPSSPAQIHMLDIGCGDGQIGLEVAQTLAVQLMSGHQNVAVQMDAIDSDPRKVVAAQIVYESAQNLAVASVREGDALSLPFAADSFDVILMLRMLNQTGDIARALAESARVLKPGGKVFIATTGIARNVTEHALFEWPLRTAHEHIQAALGFPPQLYSHSTAPDQCLDRENAQNWLRPFFATIQDEVYQRSLLFHADERAALMEFYATGLMLHKAGGIDNTPGVSADQWLELYRSVEAEMARLLHEQSTIAWAEGIALIIATNKQEKASHSPPLAVSDTT